MRASIVVLCSAAVGSTLGLGIALAHFGFTPPFELDSTGSIDTDPSDGLPVVLVDHESHDFGEIPRDVLVQHGFRFTNAGKSTLMLTPGKTTCSLCTISKLNKTQLAPGESIDVIVEYMPKSENPHFHQVAPIHTNDPRRATVDLDIFGVVVADYRIVPAGAQFSQVSVTETKTVELTLTTDIPDMVSIVRTEAESSDISSFFEITSEPIPRDEPRFKDGDAFRVYVTLKPGLPLGHFRQTIRFELSVKDRAEHPIVDIIAEGSVDGDISIAGQGWDREKNRLRMGQVKTAEGKKRQLSLLVRGKDRSEVKINPVKIDPAWLKVTLGQPEELSSGAVTQIPIWIEIPPGMQPGNYSGTDQAAYAEVLLETTHPQIKEVPLHVQFVIEK